jgi:hypothetical protein
MIIEATTVYLHSLCLPERTASRATISKHNPDNICDVFSEQTRHRFPQTILPERKSKNRNSTETKPHGLQLSQSKQMRHYICIPITPITCPILPTLFSSLHLHLHRTISISSSPSHNLFVFIAKSVHLHRTIMTSQPSYTRTGQAWVVLSSTYQSVTTKPHDNSLIITGLKSVIVGESKPPVVTTTHQLALEVLERYRKEMTSSAETAQYTVPMARYK